MVAPDLVVAELGDGLALDLQDDAVRDEVRVHPVEGEAFLNVERVVWVGIEDDLGEQAVDGHDGGLAGHGDLAVGKRGEHLARLELAELCAPLGVDAVLLEAAPEVLDGRGDDLAIGIDAALADGNQAGIRLLKEEAVEPDAGMAGRLLLDEARNVGCELDVGDAVGIREHGAFEKLVEGLGKAGRVAAQGGSKRGL